MTLPQKLRIGSDAARGDDAGNLKIAVVEWVDALYGPSVPQLKPGSKDERGLDNDSTGRLLCPSEYNWDDEMLVTFILIILCIQC